MKNTYSIVLLITFILCLILSCEEEEPIVACIWKEGAINVVIPEGYYIGKTAYKEYTYKTAYLHEPTMQMRDTFCVVVDTSFTVEPDTLIVHQVPGDTLYSVDLKVARNLPVLDLGPQSKYDVRTLYRGLFGVGDWRYKLMYSVDGIGGEKAYINYYYKDLQEKDSMREIEVVFESIRKEPNN